MHAFARREMAALFLGDVCSLILGLWLALTLRTGEVPTGEVFVQHIIPFSILFAFSVLSFLVAGLYEKHTIVFKQQLPERLLNAQVLNVLFAVVLFYLIPLFSIAPKTILVLYLAATSAFIILWRLYGVELISAKTHTRTPAVLIGAGEEMEELRDEVNGNSRYHTHFVEVIDLSTTSDSEALERLRAFLHTAGRSPLVVADVHNGQCEPLLSGLYEYLPSGVALLDFTAVYEDVFERVPLASFNPTLFLVDASAPSFVVYTYVKRSMDIVLSSILLALLLILYPFIWLIIKLDDRGPMFITQERMGKNGRPFAIRKLRTMSAHVSDTHAWVGETKNRVTRFGEFLRRTSLDEVPQVLSVFSGDMSLIGPRADITGLGERLASQIPNYMMRYHIQPGLSGWAQIKQLYKKGTISPQSVEESRLRLSYDLYYVKHRSIFLDMWIVLRTAPIILSRLKFW